MELMLSIQETKVVEDDAGFPVVVLFFAGVPISVEQYKDLIANSDSLSLKVLVSDKKK